MKITQIVTALLLCLCFVSCSRENDNPPAPPDNSPYPLLRKIAYAGVGVEANLIYNADSTLKEMGYTGSGSATVYYKYNNKQLAEAGHETSSYANTYTWENGRVVKVTNKWKQGAGPTAYYLEYTYNSDGTVATQKYYESAEAGATLSAQSVYQYDSQKLLKQITTTQANGDINTFKIEAYSDIFYATPLASISQHVEEFYSLYNYPVLSSMNRLPSKITQYRKPVGEQEKIENVEEQRFEIVDKKLRKMFAKTTYPEHPELNSEDTITYTY